LYIVAVSTFFSACNLQVTSVDATATYKLPTPANETPTPPLLDSGSESDVDSQCAEGLCQSFELHFWADNGYTFWLACLRVMHIIRQHFLCKISQRGACSYSWLHRL